MDYEKEIRFLAGETLALQAVLVGLTSRLANHAVHGLVADAFDAAASFVEDMTDQADSEAPPEHLVHSRQVVEELRSAALGRSDKPKDAVQTGR